MSRRDLVVAEAKDRYATVKEERKTREIREERVKKYCQALIQDILPNHMWVGIQVPYKNWFGVKQRGYFVHWTGKIERTGACPLSYLPGELALEEKEELIAYLEGEG